MFNGDVVISHAETARKLLARNIQTSQSIRENRLSITIRKHLYFFSSTLFIQGVTLSQWLGGYVDPRWVHLSLLFDIIYHITSCLFPVFPLSLSQKIKINKNKKK